MNMTRHIKHDMTGLGFKQELREDVDFFNSETGIPIVCCRSLTFNRKFKRSSLRNRNCSCHA